jgi:hypothetical protein
MVVSTTIESWQESGSLFDKGASLMALVINEFSGDKANNCHADAQARMR